MAVLEIINKRGKYHDENPYEDVVPYCINPFSTKSGYVAGYGVDVSDAVDQMYAVTSAYRKTKGTKVRHMVLSFAPDEIDSAETVFEISKAVAEYYADDYQIIAAVHEDTDSPHCHFAMNTTSYQDGKKYRGEKDDYYRFRAHINNLLKCFDTHLEN